MDSNIGALILAGLDERIRPLLHAREAASRPARGWVRAVREAIGLTQSGAASRAAVKRQSFAQFEAAEERGAISIASLRRAAGALDCDLVYYLVPRAQAADSYAGLARRLDPMSPHRDAADHSMSLRASDGPAPVAAGPQDPSP
jgi:predicted DNA-binding mobile mystery protein A